MVFNILSVVAFILSSLCTIFLGLTAYGAMKKANSIGFKFGKKR